MTGAVLPITIAGNNETAIAAQERTAIRSVADEANRANREMSSSGNALRDTLNELKSTFGRGSTFGMAMQTMKGVGPAMGLTVALHELDALSGKAVELSNAFHEGKIGAAEMTEELAKQIPILGQAWELGRNIREMWTHQDRDEQIAIEKMQKQTAGNTAFNTGLTARQGFERSTNRFISDSDYKAHESGFKDRRRWMRLKRP